MSGLPNPDVYLNHLPPEKAAEFEAIRNLCLAVLGATIWDILIYIPEDLWILFRGRVSSVTLCFFTSRIFSLTFLILSTLQQTHTVANCNTMKISIGVVAAVATASTSYLQLRRLGIVYTDHRWVQGVFILLWVTGVAASTVVIYGQDLTHLPGTGYCITSGVELYVSAAPFMSGIYDTAVFVAISYKLASSHSQTDPGVSWGTFISGRALPRLSRSILQGGQQYYLIITCFNLSVGILTVIPQVPPFVKIVLTFPLLSLTASMACRVLRNLIIAEKKWKERDFAPSRPSDINGNPHNGLAYKSDYVLDFSHGSNSSMRVEDTSMATHVDEKSVGGHSL